jgi:murein DD-endopeptidase MepM/ murein hydrolase activator NlpD
MVNSKRDAKFPVVPPAVPRQSAEVAAQRLGALRASLPNPQRLDAEFAAKKRKRPPRLFVDREILVKSHGRVRYLILSRRLQMSLALTAGAAVIALVGYDAYRSHFLERAKVEVAGVLAGATPPTAPAPADTELQERIDRLQHDLDAANARAAQAQAEAQAQAQAQAKAQTQAQSAKPAERGDPAAAAALDQAKARIKALEEARDRALAEQQELQRRLNAAQQAADAKTQTLAQLNRSIESSRGELRQSDNQRAGLQDRVRQLEAERDAAKAEAGEATTNLSTIEHKLQQLSAEHDKTLAEREQLATRLAELQGRMPTVPAAAPKADARTAPSMDSLLPWKTPPRAAVDRPSPDQRSENTGDLEQLIASTGIDVEDLLNRLSTVPRGEGGPYIALGSVAGGKAADPPVPGSQRAEELQNIVKTLPLASPLTDYRIESTFGGRADPFTRRQAFHAGLDLVAPYRSPVYSTAPGRVIFTGPKGPYGKVVEIDHGHGIVTRFGHLHKPLVARGQIVTVHQVVGELGSTGRSTGPHLHYEVLVNGVPQDPEKFLQAGKNVVQTVTR